MADEKMQPDMNNPATPAGVAQTSQQDQQNQTSAAPQRTGRAAPARRPLFRS